MCKLRVRVSAAVFAAALGLTSASAATVGYDAKGAFFGVTPDIYGNKLGPVVPNVVARADTVAAVTPEVGNDIFMYVMLILAAWLIFDNLNDDPLTTAVATPPTSQTPQGPTTPMPPLSGATPDPAPVVPLPGGLALIATGIGALVLRKLLR